MTLREQAPGKVNLCLALGGLREDGRHELATVIESVSLADELELTTPPAARADEVRCPGVPEPNLVASALAALRAAGWDAPPVRIEIAKRLPIAGGMAGGSADAAATLRLAPRVAPVPERMLAELAAQLGADVPSQLAPGLSLATGAGELVERREGLAPHAFLLLPQPHRLSAAEVYARADRLALPRPDPELARLRAELSSVLVPGARLPGRLLVNDLEPAALSLLPELTGALQAAGEQGAEHAFVCGSGPTVAGLYWGPDAAARAGRAAAALAPRFPAATAVIPVG